MTAMTQPSGDPAPRGRRPWAVPQASAQEFGAEGQALDQQQAGPTALRIVLGAKLRRLRQGLEISREEAGKAIRGSHAKITRLERGQVGSKERDLADLLTLYQVLDEEERAEFFALAQQANSPGWWHQYNDVLEDWFELHLGLEDAASMIRSYEIQFVPGLLQTEEYAYAVSRLGYPNTAPRRISRLVKLRMERQRLLARGEAPMLWAVLDEAALRRPFGGRQVMRGQIEHLLKMVQQPNVTVQVAPFTITAAAAGSSVTILRFSDPDLPDKVYLEHLTSAVYLDKQTDVDQYTHILNRLSAEAYPPDETVAFLRGLLEE